MKGRGLRDPEEWAQVVLMGGYAQLQAMVHGVTTEECQAALQSHSWSVQRAAQYLKVPSLPACPGIQGPCELVLLYLTLPSGSMSCALCYSGTRGSSVSNATSPSALRWSSSLGWVFGHGWSATKY